MVGKFLGVHEEDIPHRCKVPTIFLRKTFTVWQCNCGQAWRIEWFYAGTYGERDWRKYKISGE